MSVCVGVVRGHKTEGQELFYSVEKDGQRQWYNRKAVILSLEQGNKLREQHSLGPYEPSTPLAKASDISLGEFLGHVSRRIQVWFINVVGFIVDRQPGGGEEEAQRSI